MPPPPTTTRFFYTWFIFGGGTLFVFSPLSSLCRVHGYQTRLVWMQVYRPFSHASMCQMAWRLFRGKCWVVLVLSFRRMLGMHLPFNFPPPISVGMLGSTLRSPSVKYALQSFLQRSLIQKRCSRKGSFFRRGSRISPCSSRSWPTFSWRGRRLPPNLTPSSLSFIAFSLSGNFLT